MDQDGAHHVITKLLVLGRKRVDGRRDYDAAVAIESLRYVLAPGEDRGGQLLNVGRKETPASFGLLVGLISPDVASPDDDRPESCHRRCQAGRLRVVQDDDISRPDHGAELIGVRLTHSVVDSPFGVRER